MRLYRYLLVLFGLVAGVAVFAIAPLVPPLHSLLVVIGMLGLISVLLDSVRRSQREFGHPKYFWIKLFNGDIQEWIIERKGLNRRPSEPTDDL